MVQLLTEEGWSIANTNEKRLRLPIFVPVDGLDPAPLVP